MLKKRDCRRFFGTVLTNQPVRRFKGVDDEPKLTVDRLNPNLFLWVFPYNDVIQVNPLAATTSHSSLRLEILVKGQTDERTRIDNHD
jgi:hypothetical protein